MMTTDMQVKAWATEAKREFRFLESLSYEPQTPRLDVMWGTMTYLGAKLGVRLEVEIDGFFMFVVLYRPSRPEYENLKHLQTCLERLGIPTKPLQQKLLSLRGDFGNCEQMVNHYADALRSNLAALEANADSLFPK